MPIPQRLLAAAGFTWRIPMGKGPVIVALLDPSAEGAVFTRSSAPNGALDQ